VDCSNMDSCSFKERAGGAAQRQAVALSSGLRALERSMHCASCRTRMLMVRSRCSVRRVEPSGCSGRLIEPWRRSAKSWPVSERAVAFSRLTVNADARPPVVTGKSG